MNNILVTCADLVQNYSIMNFFVLKKKNTTTTNGHNLESGVAHVHDPGQEADTVQTCLFSLLSMGHLMPPTTQESWFIIIMLILMKFKLIQDQCGCSDTTTKSSKKSRWRTSCHDSQKKEYKCKQTKVANGQAISKPA